MTTKRGVTYVRFIMDDSLPALQRLVLTRTGRRLARKYIESFPAQLHGEHNIPRRGGALLVGNHTFFGIDAVPLTVLLLLQVGRAPHFLGERNLWKIPGARRLLDGCGIVRGEPSTAVRLLERGDLVCVYPGGVYDSFKLSSEAYRLKWRDRAGFVRVAMRARAPIVPIAATGVDEIYEVRAHEHWFGRRWLGEERYDFPIPKNVRPRKVPLNYYALPQVSTEGDVTNPMEVERIRRATHDAVEAVLRSYREGHPVTSQPSPPPG